MPALVSGAGAEVAVVEDVDFLVVVGSAGVVAVVAAGAFVSGALVSPGAVDAVDFFFTVVVVADLVLLVLVDVFVAAVFVSFETALGAAGAAAAAPFLVMADLIVVVGAALANVAVRNKPLSATATATGIRFDRGGTIRTDYRTSDTWPRINGYSPGHSPSLKFTAWNSGCNAQRVESLGLSFH